MRKDRTYSGAMPTQPSSQGRLAGDVMLIRVEGGVGVNKEGTAGTGL